MRSNLIQVVVAVTLSPQLPGERGSRGGLGGLSGDTPFMQVRVPGCGIFPIQNNDSQGGSNARRNGAGRGVRLPVRHLGSGDLGIWLLRSEDLEQVLARI